MVFDFEKIDVYLLSLEVLDLSVEVAESVPRGQRHLAMHTFKEDMECTGEFKGMLLFVTVSNFGKKGIDEAFDVFFWRFYPSAGGYNLSKAKLPSLPGSTPK